MKINIDDGDVIKIKYKDIEMILQAANPTTQISLGDHEFEYPMYNCIYLTPSDNIKIVSKGNKPDTTHVVVHRSKVEPLNC